MLLGIMAVISLVVAVLVCLLVYGAVQAGWLWLLPVCFVGSYLLQILICFLYLWLLAALVDPQKPQEKDSKLYRKTITVAVKAATKILLTKIHTRGLEMLPKDGRFLLVCNHINDIDPLVLIACLPKSQLAFVSKQENGKKFLVGPLMHKILCQPINRENDREALKTILKCVQILKEDKASVAVFPEGYTSMDGLLRPFRPGAFKIAQKAGVPIVVCTLQNTNQSFKNVLKLKRTDVHMHLVAVLSPEEIKGVPTVQVADQIYHLMAQDLGPDLVLPPE